MQEMLKLGVIEPSRSPWSSPIVMVPKPDGTLCFCNDFRRVNEVSEFDDYCQRLLRPHQAYAATYLDDVIVHSESWEEHLERLRRVLMELRRAGLTANPRKCHLALLEAKYLGFQVGRGIVKPQEKKVAAILSAPRPSTKTQVRAFLGLAGYYHCFIPNFSSLAAPLTDLTRKG